MPFFDGTTVDAMASVSSGGNTGLFHGPFPENVLLTLRHLTYEPQAAREERAKNAAFAVYYDQPTIAAGSVYLIAQAQSGNEYFTELFIVFEATSGKGRYMVTSERASATRGFAIAAGSSYLIIRGHQNIKDFSVTPETGETLKFSRVLLR